MTHAISSTFRTRRSPTPGLEMLTRSLVLALAMLPAGSSADERQDTPPVKPGRTLRDRYPLPYPPALPEGRTVDVLFDDYMADEMGTLLGIYDAAGIELTDQARAEIEAHRAAHPRGKDGRVVYDLRRDFSVTPEEVRARFGAYLARFPARIEVL